MVNFEPHDDRVAHSHGSAASQASNAAVLDRLPVHDVRADNGQFSKADANHHRFTGGKQMEQSHARIDVEASVLSSETLKIHGHHSVSVHTAKAKQMSIACFSQGNSRN